jgi:hypothetical protein
MKFQGHEPCRPEVGISNVGEPCIGEGPQRANDFGLNYDTIKYFFLRRSLDYVWILLTRLVRFSFNVSSNYKRVRVQVIFFWKLYFTASPAFTILCTILPRVSIFSEQECSQASPTSLMVRFEAGYDVFRASSKNKALEKYYLKPSPVWIRRVRVRVILFGNCILPRRLPSRSLWLQHF